MYRAQGDYAHLEQVYRRAVAAREQALGPEHPALAPARNDLAKVYQAMWDYARAEPLYTRVLGLVEKVLGTAHPNVAIALSNLS
jgi:tetratricopeptide (TPR) repeat protein